MEPLFLLTIPKFNMPEFGSLDEDYLCREDQLSWYVYDDIMEVRPVRILEQTNLYEEDIEWEYTDGEFKTWYFWLEHLEAECVYIREGDCYRRCVKVDAKNVLLLKRKMEEEEQEQEPGSNVFTCEYRRLGRVSGHSRILSISDLSGRDEANDKSVLHNRLTSNLYYLEREFETAAEMKADVKHPAPVVLRRFFEDILEQK